MLVLLFIIISIAIAALIACLIMDRTSCIQYNLKKLSWQQENPNTDPWSEFQNDVDKLKIIYWRLFNLTYDNDNENILTPKAIELQRTLRSGTLKNLLSVCDDLEPFTDIN